MPVIVADASLATAAAGRTPPPLEARLQMRAKLSIAIGSPILFVAVYTAGFAQDPGSDISGLVRLLAVTSLVALGFTLVVLPFTLALLMEPINDLARATESIARGDLDTRAAVSSGDEFGELATRFNEMVSGLQQRQMLHDAFGSYVDPALAQRVIESGSSMFDGEDLVVTVLFLDVRDFTAYSETVEPSDAVLLLNRLFDIVIPTLHRHGGHANHYLGDGLLAVFGSPNPLPQHADAAVAAAVDIQHRVWAEFGRSLRLGIGINTGSVIAGTVGGGGRLEFTVIGDPVNVASRVEQLTKDTGDAILLTEATRLALSTPRPRCTRRGEFDLRGKSAKVTVHALNPVPRSAR
jgi:class 3 adenylate cyclase